MSNDRMSNDNKQPSGPKTNPLPRRQFLSALAGTPFAVAAIASSASACNRRESSDPPRTEDRRTEDRRTEDRRTEANNAPEMAQKRVYMPDVYHENANGTPNWKLMSQSQDPYFFGAILKVTQGSSNYVGVNPWFLKNWPALRAAGGDRYGQTWFRGSYHYLEVAQSGKAQAEYFLQTVEQAGGWGPGDLPPAVDVETSSNPGATKEQVIQTTTEWAETVKAKLGCKVMLYGHTLMENLGITSHMGCDFLWAPQYNNQLTDNQEIGWPNDLVAFWQYTDGSNHYTSYPTSAPGIGPIDMSLFMPFASANSSGTPADLRAFAHKNGPRQRGGASSR